MAGRNDRNSLRSPSEIERLKSRAGSAVRLSMLFAADTFCSQNSANLLLAREFLEFVRLMSEYSDDLLVTIDDLREDEVTEEHDPNPRPPKIWSLGRDLAELDSSCCCCKSLPRKFAIMGAAVLLLMLLLLLPQKVIGGPKGEELILARDGDEPNGVFIVDVDKDLLLLPL